MTRFQRILLTVCILSGLAALAPPQAAGQGAGDFGSGWGTRFIYRRPFRFDLVPSIVKQIGDSLGYGASSGSNTEVFVAQVNFSNGAANDSTQFVFHNTTGLFLPIASTRKLMFEYYQYKTTYTSATTVQEVVGFAPNVVASADSTMFSVHIKGEGTSPRRYYLRIYKMHASDVSGIAPPLAAGYKVLILSQELDALATGRFPPGTGTSVQVRLTLRVRWL